MRLRDVAITITRGGATFTALALAGRVARREAWIGMRGAGKYLEAVAAGDVADDAEVDRRLACCDQCPARRPDPEIPEDEGWCGFPFEAETLSDGPTCGCRLRAKASVASEQCPRGLWEHQAP